MKITLKYIAVAISLSLLVGCGSAPQTQESKLLISGEEITTNKETVGDLSMLKTPDNNKTDEIKLEITSDYAKRLMVIDMECESSLLEYSDEVSAPYIETSDLDLMLAEGDAVIEDLTNRLNVSPSEELKMTYEQEIARLKLEYSIEDYKQSLLGVEIQKATQLDLISNKASVIFECSVKRAEALAEKERLLSLVDMSSKVEKIFNSTIDDIENKLAEAEIELEMVNQEAFDDLMF